ncbi:MAG TPA: erythromycin esterase family protein [Bacteroidetes bacterium]|nr:erythromycin esterase family protein [Bacteroidota bacterium]
MKNIVFIFLVIGQFCNAQPLNNLSDCAVLSGENYLENGFIENIAEYIKDKEIVAMGEAAHGAGEFFKMKADVFKYLAKNENFRVFAIESTLSTTYDLNKYLLYGEGDAKQSLKRLDNFYWNTAEVLDLVDWMYGYNKSKPAGEKLWFYGMDINSSYESVKAISAYIKKVEPDVETKVAKYGDRMGRVLLSDKKDNKKRALEIEKIYAENERDYIAKSSEWEYQFIKQCFVNLKQTKLPYKYRDQYMADNVGWLKNISGSKIFVWAHNYHVAKSQQTMGYFLNKKYGDGYYCIGFDFKEGEVWAKKGGNVFSVILHGNKNVRCTTSPPKEKTFTYKLAALNKPFVFFDVNNCSEKNKNLKKELSTVQKMHDAGAWFSEKSEYIDRVISRSFDGVLYIEKVSPSNHFYLKEKYEY